MVVVILVFCGVIELVLYGVNLKYKWVFVVVSIVSGLGGLLIGLLCVNNYVLLGLLIGFFVFIILGVGIGLNFYGYLIFYYGILVIVMMLVYVFGFLDKLLGFKENLKVINN